MCVTIRRSSSTSLLWDADHNLITLPEWLKDHLVLLAVRMIFADIDHPQPADGAVCWCGAPVTVQPRVPTPRQPSEAMSHGA